MSMERVTAPVVRRLEAMPLTWRLVAILLTLLLAALLRVTVRGSTMGGIAVRGPLVDVITLVVLGAAVLVSGFTLDLTAPFALPGRGR